MSLLIYTPNERNYLEWQEEFYRASPDLQIRCGIESASDDTKYVLAWKPPQGFLQTLPQLRAVFSMGAGVDHITSDPDFPDVPLIRQRDAGMGAQMAEYALYAALHYQRDFDLMRVNQQLGKWDTPVSRVRRRAKIGILGLGTLGSVVAQTLLANGFPVSGWSRTDKSMEGVNCYSGDNQLSAFLADAELLICLLPDTPKTRGIVNADVLRQLPTGAVLVNVARGPLIVDEDLVNALDSGQLRGAMLDVFHREPLAIEHPFWAHPKVILTPHIAAETVFSASAHQVVSEIARMEAGLSPSEVVDLERGY